MIKEDYVSVETASLLDKKGFLGQVMDCYEIVTIDKPFPHNVIPKPTLQMAMKWLREEHNLHFLISPFIGENDNICYNVIVLSGSDFNTALYNNVDEEETYEDAMQSAIYYCVKNII